MRHGHDRESARSGLRAISPDAPPNTEGQPKLPEGPEPAAGSTEVLVDELRALVFVDHAEKIVAGKLDAEGVQINAHGRLTLLRSGAFRRRIGPFLGGPISIFRLNQLAQEVILFYRRNNQPVVDVSIPQQDITDGVVQIVVTEGRVGRVRVEGACFFDPCMLARQTCTSSGGKIYESVLMEDLAWLNRNPFRQLDLEITPGEDYGLTDVIFKVDDRRPVRVYTGYEDTGVDSTGLERILFGANWGNALWRDHQMGYQYTTSANFQNLRAHSGIYSIALPNRDLLTVYGGYADVRTPDASPFDLSGSAWQAAIRYSRTLCPWQGYDHRVVVGFDFKQTNTDRNSAASRRWTAAPTSPNWWPATTDCGKMVAGHWPSQPKCSSVPAGVATVRLRVASRPTRRQAAFFPTAHRPDGGALATGQMNRLTLPASA